MPEKHELYEFQTWLLAKNYSAQSRYIYTNRIRKILEDLPAFDAVPTADDVRRVVMQHTPSMQGQMEAAWDRFRAFVLESGGPTLPTIREVPKGLTGSPAKAAVPEDYDLPEIIEDCAAFLMVGGGPVWRRAFNPSTIGTLTWGAFIQREWYFRSGTVGFPVSIPLIEALVGWSISKDGVLGKAQPVIPWKRGGVLPAPTVVYKRALKHARERPILQLLLARHYHPWSNQDLGWKVKTPLDSTPPVTIR